MNKHDLERVFKRRFYDAQENWKACCPYHDERTPSFYVHTESGLANCFGCGVHGYIETLYANLKGISVEKAREDLNIDVASRLSQTNDTRNKRLSVQRSIPESWLAAYPRGVHDNIKQLGFGSTILKNSDTRYDRASDRQLFPVFDRGRLVGATGRTCKGANPKWYHYWNFQTGGYLYSLPYGTAGRQSDHLVITEGVLDVLRVEQAGYSGAAIFGSKPTRAQLGLIRERASRVTLCLDNDHAGDGGTQALYGGLRKGCEVLITRLPAGRGDIAECTPSEARRVIEEAESYVSRYSLSDPKGRSSVPS